MKRELHVWKECWIIRNERFTFKKRGIFEKFWKEKCAGGKETCSKERYMNGHRPVKTTGGCEKRAIGMERELHILQKRCVCGKRRAQKRCVCKRALYLVALLRKETCNLRHLAHFRHPVKETRINGMTLGSKTDVYGYMKNEMYVYEMRCTLSKETRITWKTR